MQWFLILIGFFWIAYGCCAVLYSFEVRQGLKLLHGNVDKRLIAALPVAFGLLLAISAAWSDHVWFVRLIGLLAVIKGGIFILNPENIYDKMMTWYIEKVEDRTHRAIGIISIILGTAIISWIK
jgi:hypothetical protein